MIEFTPARTRFEIETISQLAHEIWNEHYVPFLGQAQIDYMLERLQSANAIEKQIADGFEYALVRVDSIAEGYLGVQREPERSRLFLSKLYVRKGARGRGLSRRMLEHIEQLAREAGLRSIWLTVNKQNPAIAVYEHLGFKRVGEVVVDIGSGYVMDDFSYERAV